MSSYLYTFRKINRVVSLRQLDAEFCDTNLDISLKVIT